VGNRVVKIQKVILPNHYLKFSVQQTILKVCSVRMKIQIFEQYFILRRFLSWKSVRKLQFEDNFSLESVTCSKAIGPSRNSNSSRSISLRSISFYNNPCLNVLKNLSHFYRFAEDLRHFIKIGFFEIWICCSKFA
jgi:hypothetical protein